MIHEAWVMGHESWVISKLLGFGKNLILYFVVISKCNVIFKLSVRLNKFNAKLWKLLHAQRNALNWDKTPGVVIDHIFYIILECVMDQKVDKSEILSRDII